MNKATWLLCVNFNLETIEDVKKAKKILDDAYKNASPYIKPFIDIDINWVEIEAYVNKPKQEEIEEEEEIEEDLDHSCMRKQIKGYIK